MLKNFLGEKSQENEPVGRKEKGKETRQREHQHQAEEEKKVGREGWVGGIGAEL